MTEDTGLIRLRPHHLLCVQNFRGHGYNEAFTRKMQSVVTALRDCPDRQVLITEGADDLCAACPHCRKGECESQNPGKFDALTAALAGLAPGDLLACRDFPPVTPDLLEACCPGCEWGDLCREIAGAASPLFF